MLFETDSVKQFLTLELERRVRVNPRYSQRAFAKSLGLSPGELSEVMRGLRNLSMRSAMKVSKSLGLSNAETQRLLQLLQEEKGKKLGISDIFEDLVHECEIIEEENYKILDEWYNLAILNLLECDGFKWNSQWVSQRLGISITQAKVAMEKLIRLGFVKKNNAGRFVATNIEINNKGLPSQVIRDYHKQILELANKSIELQSVHEREFIGLGFACQPKKLKAMKKELSNFIDQLSEKYSKGKSTEVYFLEMALFRLTQGEISESNF